jgi:hypothetical protein
MGSSGRVLDGLPVFCGGQTYVSQFENRCYKYDNKSWIQVIKIYFLSIEYDTSCGKPKALT